MEIQTKSLSKWEKVPTVSVSLVVIDFILMWALEYAGHQKKMTTKRQILLILLLSVQNAEELIK